MGKTLHASSHNLGKFPVKYMGNLSKGVCVGGVLAVLINLAVLSVDVHIQVPDGTFKLTSVTNLRKKKCDIYVAFY